MGLGDLIKSRKRVETGTQPGSTADGSAAAGSGTGQQPPAAGGDAAAAGSPGKKSGLSIRRLLSLEKGSDKAPVEEYDFERHG
ncbi:MAG: secretion system protein E, partial [Methanoregula sp.]